MIKKLFINKKGEEVVETMMHGLFILILLTIVLSVFILLVAVDNGSKHKIPNHVEEQILINRFFSSPDCFIFQDKIGRYHTGIIDISKFNQEQLDLCMDLSSINYGMKFELKYDDDIITLKNNQFKNNEQGTTIRNYKILIKENGDDSLDDLKLGDLVVYYHYNYMS
jgi:hypothetical protein